MKITRVKKISIAESCEDCHSRVILVEDSLRVYDLLEDRRSTLRAGIY